MLIIDDRVTEIDVVVDPPRLEGLGLAVLSRSEPGWRER
jgi:hypothetical protein